MSGQLVISPKLLKLKEKHDPTLIEVTIGGKRLLTAASQDRGLEQRYRESLTFTNQLEENADFTVKEVSSRGEHVLIAQGALSLAEFFNNKGMPVACSLSLMKFGKSLGTLTVEGLYSDMIPGHYPSSGGVPGYSPSSVPGHPMPSHDSPFGPSTVPGYNPYGPTSTVPGYNPYGPTSAVPGYTPSEPSAVPGHNPYGPTSSVPGPYSTVPGQNPYGPTSYQPMQPMQPMSMAPGVMIPGMINKQGMANPFGTVPTVSTMTVTTTIVPEHERHHHRHHHGHHGHRTNSALVTRLNPMGITFYESCDSCLGMGVIVKKGR